MAYPANCGAQSLASTAKNVQTKAAHNQVVAAGHALYLKIKGTPYSSILTCHYPGGVFCFRFFYQQTISNWLLKYGKAGWNMQSLQTGNKSNRIVEAGPCAPDGFLLLSMHHDKWRCLLGITTRRGLQ